MNMSESQSGVSPALLGSVFVWKGNGEWSGVGVYLWVTAGDQCDSSVIHL